MAKENAVQEKSAVREVLSWLITILLAVLAALIINANIPSGSMENTKWKETAFLVSVWHIMIKPLNGGIL